MYTSINYCSPPERSTLPTENHNLWVLSFLELYINGFAHRISVKCIGINCSKYPLVFFGSIGPESCLLFPSWYQ